MTEGSIAGHLIRFALPLLLGNLFQQLYNTVDCWVVGNYVSNEAYSAVGTVSPVVNLFISFFSGLSTGCGVVISQYYGAGNEKKVSDSVHAGFVLIVLLGILMSIASTFLSPVMLRVMNTPEEVFAEASVYMKIFCAGLLFLVVYNLGAAILRAVGDTTRPFWYLVATAVVNIILDLVFVLVFRMGVAGVALATVIAEAVSMILVLVSLIREKSAIRFIFRKLFRPDPGLMKSIVRIGMPSGFQMALTSFSNVFVQSYINYFGTDVMAGWTTFSKTERLALLPIQSLQMASTTFTGQNIGSGNVQRAKKGVTTAFMIGLAILAVAVPATILFAPQITAFFNAKPEAVEWGTRIIRVSMPFMIFSLNNNVHAGALRGAGDSRNVMILILCSFVLFRQIYLFIMANYISNTVIPIISGYPAGWIMATVLVDLYYRKNADRVFEQAARERSGERIT